ncbi:MAG: hypothetical protein JEZ11_23540 [Desulfobacterales bacterium]|nr:hypothetical protein [Desulfobacterales bacterium]
MTLRRRVNVTATILFFGLALWVVSPLQAGEVSQAGLNTNADPVIGKDISGSESFETAEAYQVTAEGDLTGSYGEVSATAFGVYADSSGRIVLESSGDIDVSATGGTAVGIASNATARAYATGMFMSEGDVINRGGVTVTSAGGSASSDTAGAYVEAYAAGLYAWGGDMESSEPITATATGGRASGAIVFAHAETVGFYAASGDAVSNSGDITAAAGGGSNTDAAVTVISFANAFAIYADNGGDVANDGNVFARATGGSAVNVSSTGYANADASAIHAYGSGAVANSGSITATANGGVAAADQTAYAVAVARGIYAYAGGDVTNNGDIFVTTSGGTADAVYHAYADAGAYGIHAEESGIIENSGAITVAATGGSAATSLTFAYATAETHGIYSDGGAGVVNFGDIIATAIGGNVEADTAEGIADATASGIYANGDVQNSGNVKIAATGGRVVSGGGDSDAAASARGISVNGGASVLNTGNLFATAAAGSTDASAHGIYINGGGGVANSGDITVSATGADGSSASGITFEVGGILTNTGVITAEADEAHQVSVLSATLTLEDSFNMNLCMGPDTRAIHVGETAVMDINDARLTLHYEDAAIVLDAAYNIFDAEETATVSGSFSFDSTFGALNPNVRIRYNDMDTNGADDDTVSISYQPVASPFLMSVDFLRRNFAMSTAYLNDRLAEKFMETQLRINSGELSWHTVTGAWADKAAGAPKGEVNGLYTSPFLAGVEVDASPLIGYEAETAGVSAGYERWFGTTLYCLDVGFFQTDLDYTGTGFDRNSEMQEMVVTGLHAMGIYIDNWTWRAGFTGFWAWHDYEGLTGIDLATREQAEYQSNGLNVSWMIGRRFDMGDSVGILLPEIGGEYLYVRREGFTTEAESANWNVSESSTGDDQITGVASLRWMSRMRLWGIPMAPSVSAGLRLLLTDEKIEEEQTGGSTTTLVQVEQDKVAGTVSASLLINVTEHQDVAFSYDGGFSNEATQQGLAFRWCIKF